MRYNLIVALCRNNGIGYNGQIPWRIPRDLHYFAQMTKGDGNNVVIMGNTTWKNLPITAGKPRGLPRRDNFVLSSIDRFDMAINHDHLLKTFKNIDEIETFLNKHDIYEDIWVIGGASVYKEFLEKKKIDKCYITYIDANFECDTFFPILDNTEWKEIERTESYDTDYQCSVIYSVFESIGQNTIGQNTDCL